MIQQGVPSLGKRVTRASYVLVTNLVFWVLIPYFLSTLLSSVPEVPLTSSLIYTFGATITALQVLSALTEGMAVSVPLVSGSYIASAYYIWAATNGGKLVINVQGLTISLGFTVLLYLLMLPSLFNALRAPITFLLERSEAGVESAEDTFVG